MSTVLLPFADRPLPEVPEIVTFYIAAAVLTDLITAFLRFSRFAQNRLVP